MKKVVTESVSREGKMVIEEGDISYFNFILYHVLVLLNSKIEFKRIYLNISQSILK